LPTRLSIIDDLTRPDHSFLTADDICFYLGEYSARAGYAFSNVNNLLQNLKRPMSRRNLPQWKWKERAIESFAQILRLAPRGYVYAGASVEN
jgi:hypothetical protein